MSTIRIGIAEIPFKVSTKEVTVNIIQKDKSVRGVVLKRLQYFDVEILEDGCINITRSTQ